MGSVLRLTLLVGPLLLLAGHPAAAQVCAGGPSDPNVTGASGSFTASGGSCVWVGPSGAVTGRVRTSGTYTVTNDGNITNPGGHGILDTTNDTTVVNHGTVDSRNGIDVRHRSQVTNTGTVRSAFHGIRTRNDSAVVNRGLVDSGRIGILMNHRASATNRGTIRSGHHGIRVLDDSRVDHGGTIAAGRYGIYARHRSTVTASGRITSGWDGIRLIDDGFVRNDAIITSSRRGIYTRNRGTVVNDGQVDSVLRAIEGQNDTTVVNRGVARSSAREGIYARNRASVVNRGTAQGTIGILLAGNDGSVVNSGRVTGTSGTAIRFLGGTNQLVLQTGSQIQGDVRGGSGTDSLFLEGSGRYGGAFLAFESLVRRGSGVWNLAGTSTIAGPALVSGGVLQVDGTLGAASFTVGSGGTLAGRGRVVSDVDVRGTVAPGQPGGVGTLRVQGDATFRRGSRFAVDVTTGGADLLRVSGRADLRGGTVVVSPGSGTFRDGTTYDVLVAGGGRRGEFSATTSTGSPVLRFETLYPSGRVRLRVQRLPFASLSGLTPNQSSVAGAFDRAVQSGSSPATDALTAALDFQSEEEIAAALSSMDPELFDVYPQLADHWTERRFHVLEERLRDAARPPRRLGQAEAVAPAPEEEAENADDLPAVSSGEPRTPTLWASGLGLFGDKHGGRDVTGYDFDGAGAMIGGDLPLSERLRLGLAASWQETDVRFDRAGSDGQVLNRGLALYGSFDPAGPLFADVIVQQMWNRYETERLVTIDGPRRATSRHDGRTFAAQASTGLRIEAPALSVEPRLGLRYARLSQDGFREEGAGAFGLAVDSRSSDGLESFAGLRLATHLRFLDERLELTPQIHGEWARQWLSDDRRIRATLPDLAQTSFSVRGDSRAPQQWSLGLGLAGRWNERLRFELGYEFQRGRDRLRSHALVGGLEWSF